MSWRQIHSSVAHSESLSSVSGDAERLFWRLLAQTDAWGRIRGETPKVRSACVPMLEWSLEYIDELLGELTDANRVERYTANSHLFIQLVDFDEHQPESARRRGGSIFPANSNSAQLRGTPEQSGELQFTPFKREREREREKKKDMSVSESVLEVYDCWRSELGKSDPRFNKISDRRAKIIQSRLKDGFTVSDLKQSIGAVASDSWPDRVNHNDLIVIFRHRESVDHWLGKGTSSNNGEYPVADNDVMF